MKPSDVTVVDHRSIDWDQVDAVDFPYAVRQRPGRSNALGQVKFMLRNNMNIYRHDSPADELFARTRRTFSHGCMRLEKTLELARLILQRSTDGSPDDLDEFLATGNEKTIKLDWQIPVYILSRRGSKNMAASASTPTCTAVTNVCVLKQRHGSHLRTRQSWIARSEGHFHLSKEFRTERR